LKNWYATVAAGAVLVLGVLSFASAPPSSHPAAVPYDGAPIRLRVDVSEHRLYLEESGTVTRSWSVALGTKPHPTPLGTFGIRRMIWNPAPLPDDTEWARNEHARHPGELKNPMGRVRIFFREPGYYIHGTLGGAGMAAATSHGCVRMRNQDAIELARLLLRQHGAPVETGLLRRLIGNVRQTRELRLSRPIPLRIVA
jgi:lipoprotein-anchoring transpeptidase ErfK/SrfK